MTDDLCPRCGWVLGSGVVACPACGERLASRKSGYETVVCDVREVMAAVTEGHLAGTSLLPVGAAEADAENLALKRKAFLIRRGGGSSGQRLEVTCPTTTVGRLGAEINVDDAALSGRHFAIEERGHEFFLRDLGSTNGTYLNGHLVRSAPLESGDEIRAGASVFEFLVLDVIPCG